MKISEFSSRFQIPASTVRYYVESGILAPNKKNAQYVFTELDVREMEVVQKLKALSFSMEEIRQFLQIIRMYNMHDSSIREHLLRLYQDKEVQLKLEKQRISRAIQLLDLEMKEMNHETDPAAEETGIPLAFAAHLACPTCAGLFSLSQIQVRNNQIFSGLLHCSCGYHATIEEGILLVNSDTSFYQSPEFNTMHYGELPSRDQDFVFFEYMNRISEQTTALLFKGYAWIDHLIRQENLQPRFIFVPDLASHFLYKYAESPWMKDAFIIVSGFTRRTIQAIKSHIDSLNAGLNILYIANTIHALPIGKHRIDLWIDAVSSYNFGFFHEKPLHDYISPYIADGAFVAGLTKYLEPGSRSLANIRRLYTHCNPGNSLQTAFLETLNRNGWALTASQEVGSVSNPGEYYEYMATDELHHFLCYGARKTAGGKGEEEDR